MKFNLIFILNFIITVKDKANIEIAEMQMLISE